MEVRMGGPADMTVIHDYANELRGFIMGRWPGRNSVNPSLFVGALLTIAADMVGHGLRHEPTEMGAAIENYQQYFADATKAAAEQR